MAADEYLYRDAKNREIRQEQRYAEAQQELESTVNAVKMSSKSIQMLRRKYVRSFVLSLLDFCLFGEKSPLVSCWIDDDLIVID